MGEFARIHRSDITDRQLMAFWDAVRAAGRDRDVAYCLPPMDGPGFVRWMRQPDISPWIILFQGEPCGLFFLTDHAGKAAQCHFCTLPTGTRRTGQTAGGRFSATIGAGLFALGQALWERSVSGGFLLDTLIGVTPTCNRAALRYIHALGAQDCGIVPGACWYHDTGENVPGLYTVFTRQALPEWTASI